MQLFESPDRTTRSNNKVSGESPQWLRHEEITGGQDAHMRASEASTARLPGKEPPPGGWPMSSTPKGQVRPLECMHAVIDSCLAVLLMLSCNKHCYN